MELKPIPATSPDDKMDLIAEVGIDENGREYIVDEGPNYP